MSDPNGDGPEDAELLNTRQIMERSDEADTDSMCGHCGGQGIICLLSKPPKYQDCPVCHGGFKRLN